MTLKEITPEKSVWILMSRANLPTAKNGDTKFMKRVEVVSRAERVHAVKGPLRDGYRRRCNN